MINMIMISRGKGLFWTMKIDSERLESSEFLQVEAGMSLSEGRHYL